MANVKDTQNIFTTLLESRNTKRANVARVMENKQSAKKSIKESTNLGGFTGRLLRESVEDNVTDDILDNITVVTDPDKTVKELETRADDIQDAIDKTPEGEAAFSDEYVGDKVYACPICGESFFADEEYKDGDICPICKAEPQDGFLMQGVVAPAEPESDIDEDIPEDSDIDEEEPNDEEEPTDETDSEIEVDTDDESDESDDEAEEDGKEESYNKQSKRLKPKFAKKAVSEKTKKVVEGIEIDDPEDECDCEVVECDQPKYLDTDLDERSLESLLRKFLRENYKGTVKSVKLEKAIYDEVKDAIRVEGKMALVNGKQAPIKLEMKESRYNNGCAVFTAREYSNVFKMENAKAPFKFKVRNVNNRLTFEAMNYRYVASHHTAGKVVVEGKVSKAQGK